MNHKNSNSDSGEIDDLVMDSMMRSYGRSSDDSEDFLENVLSKIDSVEEKKHQRSVFGRPSLLDAAGLRSEAGHRQEPAALVSSSTTENRSWLLPIITTVALVSAVAFATAWWVTNSNHSHERSQIADKSVVEPDSRNELTTVNALALEPPKDQIASAVIEESANAKLAEVSQKQNLGSENQPSEKEVKEYIKETVTNFHSGFPVPDFPFWTLEINFLENGVATAKLNDENFGATFNFLSADLVLARISHEVARRVHFVSPILEEQWSGAVFITGPDMSDKLGFVGIDEMHQAFCKSREIVKNMRAQFKQTFDKPAWQKLNHPIVSATTNKTEQLLRNIAPDSHEEADLLFLRMMGDSKSKRFKNYRTISQAELLEFFSNG